MSYVLGEEVTLVSGAEECAKDVYRCSPRRPDGTEPRSVYRFLTTGAPGDFERIGRRFLGPELAVAAQYAGGLS